MIYRASFLQHQTHRPEARDDDCCLGVLPWLRLCGNKRQGRINNSSICQNYYENYFYMYVTRINICSYKRMLMPLLYIKLADDMELSVAVSCKTLTPSGQL